MPSQYRAIWTVPGGGTGYSVLHTATAGTAVAAQSIADRIGAFFLGLQSLFPDDVQINFDSEVVDLDVTGVLLAAHAVAPPVEVNGSSSLVYARAQGARIDWATGEIVAGHRLTGRTYLVPVHGGCFDTEGLLTAATVNTISVAATALLGGLSADARPMHVWSRTHSFSNAVQQFSVPPAGAILRSRRD